MIPTRTRLFAALLLFVVSACGGGGCSNGLSSCGTTPLPGPFPQPEIIPNAAAIRVTRSGLDFFQANLTSLAQRGLGANAPGGIASFAIPQSKQNGATVCTPNNPVPPQCQAEIGVDSPTWHAKVRINAVTPNKVKLDGTLPVRIRDLPVSFFGFQTYVVVGDPARGDLCAPALRGSPSFPFKEFPLNVELPLDTETRIPRTGYTRVGVGSAVIDVGITRDDVRICDDTCGGAPFCQGFLDFVKNVAFDSLINGVKKQVRDGLGGAFCTAPVPTASPPCPLNSTPDDPDPAKATKCVFTGTTECVPSLLGADGHVDLARALASFSPGTTGGLDFVLASAGDMNPAPAQAGVPAWTPRKPPVPAEDNNPNGISLAMRGGAIATPPSSCVEIVRRPAPQGIPVPPEMISNTISPWPAGTPGPHLGFAVAGRYLEHAALGAYNSGALCLGISSETVTQLSSGALSLLAPSLKTLTIEEASTAAAIATRPGAPPKLKIGGGTDVKTDPLLSITMERLAVDFYVFSYERFVRAFTFTSDVTVPINVTTSKEGVRPVLGDLVVERASVTNDELLFEEGPRIAEGLRGLLGGFAGQFLGGGLAPIDLDSALAGAGLGMEIPEGGIRRLTSGSDDFIAVFANMKSVAGAAHEEADTRATLLEKIVDRDAMSLTTAVRARYPKLRVAVEGIASKPTEHTHWIDRGTRSAWTTAKEIVVDQDAMILQGKHVLYVASRIAGDAASEDGTPVAIPFAIDTLPPRVEARREGRRVSVNAFDIVSPRDALRARHRAGDGPWTEWLPFAEEPAFDADGDADVEVEVSDEEGNVGRVSLALRGRGDPTITAGGPGCGCRASYDASRGRGAEAALAFALAAAVAFTRARRRTSTRGNARGTS